MHRKLLPLLLLLSACSGPSPYTKGPTLGENPDLLGPNITEEIQNGEFFIGPGDKMTLAFWQHADLSKDYQVRADGAATLHLVGRIPVAGLTLSGLQAKLEDAYGKYLRDPSLDIRVEYSSQRKVTILGQVSSAGVYPLATPRTTILDMIATAGGISADGDQTAVLLAREVQGRIQVNAYDLDLLVNPSDISLRTKIPYVQPGDYMYVLRTKSSEYSENVKLVSDTLRAVTFAQRTVLMTENAAAAFQGD